VSNFFKNCLIADMFSSFVAQSSNKTVASCASLAQIEMFHLLICHEVLSPDDYLWSRAEEVTWTKLQDLSV